MTNPKDLPFTFQDANGSKILVFEDGGMKVIYDENDLAQVKRIKKMISSEEQKEKMMTAIYNLKKAFDCQVGIVLRENA